MGTVTGVVARLYTLHPLALTPKRRTRCSRRSARVGPHTYSSILHPPTTGGVGGVASARPLQCSRPLALQSAVAFHCNAINHIGTQTIGSTATASVSVANSRVSRATFANPPSPQPPPQAGLDMIQ